MDDDNLMDVDLTGLDLNREPVNLPLHRVARYGSLMNELENTHERIEERIRQLEAVTARARQRQRWRQARNSMETSYVPSEMMVDVGERGVLNENNNRGIVERTAERGKGCKRDSSHLVAKALEMDPEVKKANKEGGSFYDCNICLEEAMEPILTCCGHLFCWPCFYQVPEVDSTSKECPVCKGEVSDSTVIPIYGNGGHKGMCDTETGLKIPPRPKARRVESVRQQRLTQGLSHVPVAEALRRIWISIGAMGNQTQQDGGGGILNFDASQEGQNAESGSGHHIRIHQVSRVLSESAASLSSLSSALSNAERLVEDLETVINSRLLRNDTRGFSVGNHFARPSTVVQSMNQPPDSTVDINTALPIGSSSQSTDVSGSIVHVMAVRASGDINMPVAPSSSSRPRRIIMSRTSDLDTRDSREPRRRRLN
ncbi:E3 ubiquitin-protein ligase RMA1H1 [Sesamum alatum]|uniref:E3 ubiquitin-protein ligase RMA n=1 Tax=Sesamum alatum TaxID=300844 RepID=A0AAE1XQG1_9LAMI|nr:E3 ubiquitin-protein ligase RMA1H1 [Sesamum alatum]